MAAERRRSPRFSVDQVVEISFGRERFVHARGINISESGLLCVTDDYLEPATQISLMMSLETEEGNHRFGCEGVVVRSDDTPKGFKSAISFTFLEDDDSRMLETFLKNKKNGSK